MEKKINVAIVGYGGMARCWHIKRLKEMTDIFEIVGAYDIDPERNRLFEKDSGVKAFSSMDELLNSGKVELAIVAVPNYVHKPVCIELLEHKINVICEKPVCLSSEELEAMIAAANKNGVVFTAHQNRRWDEDFLSVKKVYDENELGKIFRIESRVHGSRGIPGDWRNQKCHGGGMVLDWGIHLFDQLYCLTGWDDIVSVHADLTYVTNAEVDDGFSVTLKFRNGLVAFVEVGTSNFIELPRWYSGRKRLNGHQRLEYERKNCQSHRLGKSRRRPRADLCGYDKDHGAENRRHDSNVPDTPRSVR